MSWDMYDGDTEGRLLWLRLCCHWLFLHESR